MFGLDCRFFSAVFSAFAVSPRCPLLSVVFSFTLVCVCCDYIIRFFAYIVKRFHRKKYTNMQAIFCEKCINAYNYKEIIGYAIDNVRIFAYNESVEKGVMTPWN